jgi:hypothetical protein
MIFKKKRVMHNQCVFHIQSPLKINPQISRHIDNTITHIVDIYIVEQYNSKEH